MNATPWTTDGSESAEAASRALIRLCRAHPELWHLSRKIRSIQSQPGIKTAAIDDSFRIYLEPTWFDSRFEKQGILLHEILHPVFSHFSRFEGMGWDKRNEEQRFRWNVAADKVINTLIRDVYSLSLPQECVFPSSGYQGALVTEAMLADHQTDEKSKEPAFGYGCGQEPSQDCEDGDDAQEDLRSAIDAWHRGLRAGGGRKEHAFRRLVPQPMVLPPWKRYLQGTYSRLEAESKGHQFTTYARSKERCGVINPTYRGSLPTVAIVIDTSGSMTDEARTEIVKHCSMLAAQHPSIKTLIVSHTDRVEFSSWARAGTTARMAEKACGFTGGTYVAPAYAHVKEKMHQCDVMVHFTDCYIENPWPTPPAKKLVVCDYGSGYYSGVKPPAKATVVKMRLGEK